MSSRLKKLKIVFQYEGVDGLKILDHLLNLFDSCKYMKKFYIHEKSVSTKFIKKKSKKKDIGQQVSVLMILILDTVLLEIRISHFLKLKKKKLVWFLIGSFG